MTEESSSAKSRLVALLLCFFLGWTGAHRFYVRKFGTGILMLLTAGGLGLWILIDLVSIMCGLFRDQAGQRLLTWFEVGSV